ncbi:MAG: hypothetical protein HYY48_08105 [Gammaproteobacteria bacterium]|nr:hypothetical protein [Gammaproteobacteria bacterium]
MPTTTDTDQIVLEDAKEAAFTLDKAYRRAIQNGDMPTVQELKPKVTAAYNALSRARKKLLAAGVVTTENDVKQMRLIRAEIDQAAQTQQLVIAAAKLAAKLATFV